MIIKLSALKKSYEKEMQHRIEQGLEYIPTKHAWKANRIYKNEKEYIAVQTKKWITKFKKRYQNGEINNIIDVINQFKRRQYKPKVDQ